MLDGKIPISNIYYMLSYAFRTLQRREYEEVGAERFTHAKDLFAEILLKGTSRLLKQGLHRTYVPQVEELRTVRGKVALHPSLRLRVQRKQMLTCEYDEFSEDHLQNQILKLTCRLLMADAEVAVARRRRLRQVLVYFAGVSELDPTQIRWDQLYYWRSNESYAVLMNVCRFVLEGLLQTTRAGEYSLANVLDEQTLAGLYEAFVLNYYREHHARLDPRSRQLRWAEDGVGDDAVGGVGLPVMRTDVELSYGGKRLIIDTKFYEESLVKGWSDGPRLRSAHLYQIFSYVKNADPEGTGDVAGMLLYARSAKRAAEDADYRLSGSRILVRSLDLSGSWAEITAQLDGIAEGMYGIVAESGAYH